MAESLACFQTVRYAKDLDFRRVIIEGDSLTVIKRINEGVLVRSVIAPLIHDICIAAMDFENMFFSFARREANKTAHVIARDYCSQYVPCYWIEKAPTSATLAANLDRLKLVFT
ncbi:hypothetical protein V6N13_059129 [Hibiscus sabdariffa]|uniref:RNase H type-1 domain-containing protein n=1 Tax=Hibiscus sabdariffa TaxID=183260 RepID=A0ABR2GF75_9ROSI